MANPYSSDEEKAESRLRRQIKYGQPRGTVDRGADDGLFISVGPSGAAADQAHALTDAGGFIDIGTDY